MKMMSVVMTNLIIITFYVFTLFYVFYIFNKLYAVRSDLILQHFMCLGALTTYSGTFPTIPHLNLDNAIANLAMQYCFY